VIRESTDGPDHPWPDEITSYQWGGEDALKSLTKVVPVIVAEVAVTSLSGCSLRSGLLAESADR
jgi:hypothetical protein